MSKLISVFSVSLEGEQGGVGEGQYITKRALARQLGVSERTIYDRDIRLGMISRSYREEIRVGAYSTLSPRQVEALIKLHNLYAQGLNIKSIKRKLSNNPNLF